MRAIQRFLEDLDWASAHHTALLKRYRDQWVAIYKQHVVAHGTSLAQVKRAAQAKTGRKHIPVYFVDSGASIYYAG
jgi:hypothetical protein